MERRYRVISYGSRYAVVDTADKGEPVIVARFSTKWEALEAADHRNQGRVGMVEYEHVRAFWDARFSE